MSFETDADVLGMFSADDFGTTITYARVGAAWSPLAFPVIIDNQIEELGIAATRGVAAPHLVARLAATSLPDTPTPLDTVTLADASVWEVSIAEMDSNAATWTLHLKRLSAALTDDAGRRLTDDLRAGLTA
jgi:hypothetical protein